MRLSPPSMRCRPILPLASWRPTCAAQVENVNTCANAIPRCGCSSCAASRRRCCGAPSGDRSSYEMRDVLGSQPCSPVPLASGCFMVAHRHLPAPGWIRSALHVLEDYDLSLRIAAKGRIRPRGPHRPPRRGRHRGRATSPGSCVRRGVSSPRMAGRSARLRAPRDRGNPPARAPVHRDRRSRPGARPYVAKSPCDVRGRGPVRRLS